MLVRKVNARLFQLGSQLISKSRSGGSSSVDEGAMSADALTTLGTCMFDDGAMAAKLPAAVVTRFNECLISGAPTPEDWPARHLCDDGDLALILGAGSLEVRRMTRKSSRTPSSRGPESTVRSTSRTGSSRCAAAWHEMPHQPNAGCRCRLRHCTLQKCV